MDHHFREQEDFVSKQGATRRNVLKGVLAGAAAGAAGAPAATAEPVEELPIEKFTRLSQELSDVLNDYLGGKFYARIYPSASYEYPIALTIIDVPPAEIPPSKAANYHAEQLAKAMGRIDPRRAYRFHVNLGKGYAIIVGDPLGNGEC